MSEEARTADQHLDGVRVPSVAEISGNGLRLRPWRPESGEDAEAWLRGVLDPEFLRWNTPLRAIATLDDARASLRARLDDAAQGVSVSFCVTDAATGAVLGHMGVNAIEPLMRTARVGYWVLPEARGRRVAHRALALATAWSFTATGLHRIDLGHALGHDASCRIAERCGYRYEGTLRGAMFEEGRKDAFRDVHLHGRLATDPYPPVADA
ncbi:GNAT family N-acetyltransferase [Streptomyces sp. TS71-3]|uniref:GNAT family N-acetyltransferase n=1 Tax=Streptomyces sp. TS71-3 TaxID=2733862 RepID=UPI001B1DC219|nr:GNAT family N-acetyltransferase [Streptomyces sp. TS71-3]GHJ39849.1 acetyltransferase [Streptomyces sp. TS71-3]